MLKEALSKVSQGRPLSREEAAQVMRVIMEGEASPVQVAGLLVGLRVKGETVDELTGFAQVMREKSVRIKCKRRPLLDTCGTGGDTLKTFNISTAAAFVAAGAGVVVAKHGNRSVTSRCGSADVLEALGVNLQADADTAASCLEEVGIAFLFAPGFHPAMKHAAPIRRELGIRTAFNLLGPLTNPAGATCQLLGVPAPEWVEPIARVLANLGCERALVVHGAGGLDEVSTLGDTVVAEVRGERVKTYCLSPSDFGLRTASAEDLCGGEPAENARLLLDVLSGQSGCKRDIVLANAAAALIAAGLADSPALGMELAAASVDSGAAMSKLEALSARTTRPQGGA
jgi:anthranilate phosphoribosyltransferase